ncbi:MAG: NUDIX hydrolase [Bacillota bacterium]|nr:NUDIX hydrolase [Bacillota bacterium]
MEKTIKEESIYKGKILELKVLDVELPDKETSKREIVINADAVVVIAFDKDNNLFFVKQYRKAIEDYLLELPAGKIDPGESPKETAKRELAEEIGYTSEKMELLFSIYSSPGFSKEKIYVYKASNLIEKSIECDDDEFIEIIKLPYDQVLEDIKENKIEDSKTVSAVLYYNQFINK